MVKALTAEEKLSRRLRRFHSNVDRSAGPDGCWPWMAARISSGYGSLRWGGKGDTAHRVAWMLANGAPIPDGMYVMHACDHRPCCNPAHLSVGWPRENALDMFSKSRDRILSGEDSFKAKLTSAQVEDIRELRAQGRSARSLGRQYGVSHKTICSLTLGDSWAGARGPLRPRNGLHHGAAKLSAQDVQDVRRRAEAGESHSSIARSLGVSQPTVTRAVNRVTYHTDRARLALAVLRGEGGR